MPEDSTSTLGKATRIVTVGLGLSWFELVGEIWNVGRKIVRGLAKEGMYQVLEYETTLELLDPQGKNATVKKRQKVRFLQDNILAYQDQAWGDGKILLNYQCSPGVPVDQYRTGHKTNNLISLREIMNKGDITEFNIKWDWKDGFLVKTGFWGTRIDHRTKFVKVQIIIPESRPPLFASMTEINRKKTQVMEEAGRKKLPDGRWLITWEKEYPKLYETYLLKWEW